MNNKWQETKKEFKINEKGEYVATHVTMERDRPKILGFEKKDFWDQLLKSVGIVAIVIPLILFKCSRDADIDKQKNMLQLELFSNVLADVQRMILLSDTSSEFKTSKSKIDIDYYSKMTMLGNDSIVSIYKELKNTITIYSLVADANHILDSIIKQVRVIRDASRLSEVEVRRLSSKSKTFKDSVIKSRSNFLEKSSVQWDTRKNLIDTFNKEDAGLKDTLFNILVHLNTFEPNIRTYTHDTLSTLDVKLIEKLSAELYGFLIEDRKKTADLEKHFRGNIEKYYFILNKMMKDINKILSTKI